MRRAIMTALAAAATISFASPAWAAVIVNVSTTNGTPLQDAIHASQTNDTDNAVQVFGSTDQGGQSANVTFTGGTEFLANEAAGNSNLAITDGGGFAAITDSPTDGTLNLSSLIINPDQLFSDLKFSIQLTQDGAFTVYYLLSSGGGFVPAPNMPISQDAKGNNNYLVDVTGGTFDAVQIVSTVPLFEIKQMSINNVAPGAVPEPATWAMMLLGFGGIGLTMRRRKPTLAQIA